MNKFQVGDKVLINGQIVVRTVYAISKNGMRYNIGKGSLYHEDDLVAYIPPKFNEGDVVTFVDNVYNTYSITKCIMITTNQYVYQLYDFPEEVNEEYITKYVQYPFNACKYTDCEQCSFKMGCEYYNNVSASLDNIDNTLNLSKILTGHEGNTFYYYGVGNVILDKIEVNRIKFKHEKYADIFYVKFNGCSEDFPDTTDIVLFPSNEQRDWNKWVEEQKHKDPKTWETYVNTSANKTVIEFVKLCESNSETDTTKSIVALYKICNLIKEYYGGIVTQDDFKSENGVYIIFLNTEFCYEITRTKECNHIAFHTMEQAEQFLSYPDNVQLLNEYFNVKN